MNRRLGRPRRDGKHRREPSGRPPVAGDAQPPGALGRLGALPAEGIQRPEADAAFASPCDFGFWPAITIRVVAGAADRFFPVEFQQRVARERLGIEADVLPGGHLIALAEPGGLASYLLAD
jgi:hypothetical protein